MTPILMSNSVLSETELRAIGNVAVESTYCEHMVEDLIWSLTGLDKEQGKFFTDRMLLDRRLDLLSDLWKPKLSGTKLEKVTKLISDLKIENTNRNTIIHGFWHFPKLAVGDFFKDRPFPPAHAEKRRLKKDPLKFSATNILKTAERISDLTAELWQFAYDEGLLT